MNNRAEKDTNALAYQREYYKNNKEKCNAAVAKWREENKERAKEINREAMQRYMTKKILAELQASKKTK